MITEHDKALAALLMAGVQVLNSFGVLHVDQATASTLIGIITPAIVWLVPNK